MDHKAALTAAKESQDTTMSLALMKALKEKGFDSKTAFTGKMLGYLGPFMEVCSEATFENPICIVTFDDWNMVNVSAGDMPRMLQQELRHFKITGMGVLLLKNDLDDIAQYCCRTMYKRSFIEDYKKGYPARWERYVYHVSTSPWGSLWLPPAKTPFEFSYMDADIIIAGDIYLGSSIHKSAGNLKSLGRDDYSIFDEDRHHVEKKMLGTALVRNMRLAMVDRSAL